MRTIALKNHIQTGIGIFIILIYTLYGSFISSLYILEGEKGEIRSADFYIFVIVLFLLFFSNLGKNLIREVAKINSKNFLILFILYIAVKVFFDAGSIVSIGTLVKNIGINFLAGFIALTILKSRMPILSGLFVNLQSTKWLRRLTIFITIIYNAIIVYFLTIFSELSIFDMFSDFQINSIDNDYYQDFGDYITIAYCCLVSMQVMFIKSSKHQNFAQLIFFGVIAFQTFITFSCLQSVMSNKSVAVIVPVCLLAIYYIMPKGWLFSRKGIKVNIFRSIFLLLITIILVFIFIPEIDSSNLRLFDYGASSSFFTNSSVQSRISLIEGSFMQQFLDAPLIGNISLTTYMHSSLLSIQTHLGIIGTFLFLIFVVSQMFKLYKSPGNEALKVIALPILFVSVISSFFTWGPLWFLMGALYEFAPNSTEKDYKYAA